MVLQSVGAIALLLFLFLGLPILILWTRDRSGFLGRIMGLLIASVSLLFGLIIAGWIIYNVFRPTPEFQASYHGLIQLVFPIAFIWYGLHQILRLRKGIDEKPPSKTG